MDSPTVPPAEPLNYHAAARQGRQARRVALGDGRKWNDIFFKQGSVGGVVTCRRIIN